METERFDTSRMTHIVYVVVFLAITGLKFSSSGTNVADEVVGHDVE